MSWTASILVALLAGVATCVTAGIVASVVAPWLGISSFEGASGYFVVAVGLAGFLAGVGMALIVARTLGAQAGALPTIGAAVGAPLLLVALFGLSARVLGDVPPPLPPNTEVSVDSHGPFTIRTWLRSVDSPPVAGRGGGPVHGSVVLEHNGAPFTFEAEKHYERGAYLTVPSTVMMAATLPGTAETLFVRIMDADMGQACYLVTSDAGAVSARLIGHCSFGTYIERVDAAAPAAPGELPTTGFHTALFAPGATYRIGGVLLDTGTLAITEAAPAS